MVEHLYDFGFDYLKSRLPKITWWVRFGRGQATGPFGCRADALRNVDAEIIHMGHHSGYTVVGQLSGLGVAPSHDTIAYLADCGIDPPFVILGTTHAGSEENLVVRYGKETCQVFKKVEKKKGARR
jgi:hypothetical protein